MNTFWRKFRTAGKFAFIRLTRDRRSSIPRLLQLAFFMGLSIGMLALNFELTEGPQRYLKSLDDVDHWITQKGATSLSSSSYVPPEVVEELREAGYRVDGTLVFWNVVNDRPVTYQSYDPNAGILNPQLKEGRQVETIDETVLDHVLASSLGIEVGDRVKLLDNMHTVVGLSEESNSLVKEVVFINQEAMTRLVGNPTYQAVAVQLTPGQAWPPSVFSPEEYIVGPDDDPSKPGARWQVMTHDEFIVTNLAYQVETITLFFLIIIGVATIYAALSLLIAMKRDFDSRQREHGIMRAVGSQVGMLRSIELIQVLTLTLFGLVPAVGVAWLIALGVNSGVPGVTAEVLPDQIITGLVLALIISLLASLSPMRRLRKLRPVVAIQTAQ